jgi:hypothetical protein
MFEAPPPCRKAHGQPWAFLRLWKNLSFEGAVLP